MILTYLKLAFRLLYRNPFFSTINLLGLAVGFASFFGLWGYAVTELKSDQHHRDFEKIFRLATDWNWTDDHVNWGHMIIQASPSPTIPRVKPDLAEVVDFVRIMNRWAVLSSAHNAANVFKESKIIEADSNLFRFFSIPLVIGTPGAVLRDGNSIVLSEKMAHKYFGDEDPLNKILILNGTKTLKVTGLFEDLPHHTHLDFEFVLSNQTNLLEWDQGFNDWALNYVKISDSNSSEFEKKINSRIDVYWAELFRHFNSVKATIKLQALRDVAFERDHDDEGYRMKSRSSLFTMAGVGITILVMAWLNYINLTISRTARRIKEVATRKVSGAGSLEFMKQFMTEAFVTNFVAAVLAITFLQLFREPAAIFLNVIIPGWNNIELFTGLFFLLMFAAGVIFTGVYPAWVTRVMTPVELFKQPARRGKGVLLSTLTTLQYSIAIMLLFFAFVMHDQLNFVLNLDTGHDTKNVFLIDPAIIKSQTHMIELERLKMQLSAKPGVRNIMQTSFWKNLAMRHHPNSELLYVDGTITQEDHIPFFKNRIIAGRNFVKDDREDVIIVSELTTRRLGFSPSADAVGRTIIVGDSARQVEIIGVIEDFRTISFLKMENTESSHGRGQALIYKNMDGMDADVLALRFDDNQQAALAGVERTFKTVFPNLPFNGIFLDEWIGSKYLGEKTLRNQITFFTALAMVIACLGLLGMTSNTVVEKTRELGIRKALGAGSLNIIRVLLDSTLRHIVFATCIGLASAYYVSQVYLDRYEQRIPFNALHFGIPLVLLTVIMGGTIATLVIRVVRGNPVEALRHE
jgi:putative ABC transport system permease protein